MPDTNPVAAKEFGPSTRAPHHRLRGDKADFDVHASLGERSRLSRLRLPGQGRKDPSRSILISTGGTSIAAPELAGFFAQENAYLLYIGAGIGNNCYGSSPCAPLGQPNQAIYYEGFNAPYAAHYPFYDILEGCNSNDVTAANGVGYFCAGTGYDLVTGWGSVNMLHLAWLFNTWAAGDFGGLPFSSRVQS
jgi:hypothetical protein